MVAKPNMALTSELNRLNGDAGHTPNLCIGPIAAPPFYAVTVWPGAGMSSIMRRRYPGPGVTLGPAMAFAWCTIMLAAKRPPG